MQLEAFGNALIYLLVGMAFVCAGFVVTRLVAPRRPYAEKLTSYECGEEPSGDAWVQFNPRYFGMALIFLVFDVEILLLFPFAVVYADSSMIAGTPGWGALVLVEFLVFMSVLALGLVYIWQRGDIDWQRPQSHAERIESPVPASLYAAINTQVAAQRPRKPQPVLTDANSTPDA